MSTAILGILLAEQLVKLVELLFPGVSAGRQIANAQIFFNVIGVALVLPFLPAIARALTRVSPDAKGSAAVQVADPHPDQLGAKT